MNVNNETNRHRYIFPANVGSEPLELRIKRHVREHLRKNLWNVECWPVPTDAARQLQQDKIAAIQEAKTKRRPSR